MELEEKYLKEYAKQVRRYLDTFEIIEKDLAKLAGSTSDNIRKIVNGEVGLNIKKMIKIAAVFGIPYYHFANPEYTIPRLEQLPKDTHKKVSERKRKGITTRDSENKFSIKLDSFIQDGNLNTPISHGVTLRNYFTKLPTRPHRV